MIKRLALKKIIITSLSFLILLIIYFFPTTENYNINTTLTYSNPKTIPIYLVDNNNLVSRFEIIQKSKNSLELVDEVINNLTIDNNSTSHIPNNFKKIIPKNTKIINKDLNDGLLKINFTKELLNINKDNEEKMIESIIYSLTEIKDVKKIMIFVEGENLKELPNSKKTLPLTLDRSYGINKVYELESMKDITKITTYYVSKIEGYSYFTPVTTITNTKNEKVEVIIEKLKTSPTYQTNLISYLATSAELLDYEILENSVNLSFNNEVLSLEEDKIIEEVKYSIALSIRDTYNINETIFYVDNMLIDVFFL
ncbi:MAG: GerMN domain-containing protein [Bacilli bacterium]|nr:GerMN domain-containing protein [Bacilli bacterium]